MNAFRAVRSAAKTIAAFLLVAGGPGCERESPPRADGLPDVALIIVDTLRADRLGCYGYPDARTPAMDRVARGGAQFRTAISQAPVTAPSVSTIVTGTFPPFHGVRDNAYFNLPESMPTL
ncbi:MAG TPA: sulfatase-like hydrolase/transferase, partial [bacterium]|nr:sulfatase-like hydrolase/transferase [bacterium]